MLSVLMPGFKTVQEFLFELSRQAFSLCFSDGYFPAKPSDDIVTPVSGNK